jgi:hypothetical protein
MNPNSDRALLLVLSGSRNLIDPRLVKLAQEAGASSLQVNVSDPQVKAGFRVATLDPPADSVLVLTGDVDCRAMVEALGERAEVVRGWWTEVETPIPPPDCPQGQRLDALASVALLRRPAGLEEAEWLRIWKEEHTPLAIEVQASFGYVQHRVVDTAVAGSPEIAAVVEEHFPLAAVTDQHAFFGTDGDDDELERRRSAMARSIQRFGADRALDVLPTSRYRWTWDLDDPTPDPTPDVARRT